MFAYHSLLICRREEKVNIHVTHHLDALLIYHNRHRLLCHVYTNRTFESTDLIESIQQLVEPKSHLSQSNSLERISTYDMFDFSNFVSWYSLKKFLTIFQANHLIMT